MLYNLIYLINLFIVSGNTSYSTNRDRNVKVYLNGTTVNTSSAQSEYSRFLNLSNDFNAVSNTLGDGSKTFDVSLKNSSGTLIPQTGDTTAAGTAAGSTYRPLKFNSNRFIITDDTTYNAYVINNLSLPNPLVRQYGYLGYSDHAVSGTTSTITPGISVGLLSNITVWEQQGDSSTTGAVDSDGAYKKYLCGLTGPNASVDYYGVRAITQFNLNPSIWGKIKINSIANFRTFIGLNSGGSVAVNNGTDNYFGAGTTPPPPYQGFAFGAPLNSTNWKIMYNGSTGGSVTSTTDTGVPVTANTVVTFNIWADNANSRIGWSVNGSAPAYITGGTANIPAATTPLLWMSRLESQTTASNIIMNAYYYYIENLK